MGFKVNALGEIIKTFCEDKGSLDILKETLSNFCCSKNPDEENFLRDKAIDYERLNKARTYLLVDENDFIVGFFSLAFKSIDLQGVSKQKKKDLTAGESNEATCSAYLIGHIAKDDRIKQSMGDRILEVAINLLLDAQKIVGGRIVYLDCKDEDKLIKLYERNNFKWFNVSEKSGLQQYYKKL